MCLVPLASGQRRRRWMVDVEVLERGAYPIAGSDWIIIEPLGRGFIANGVVGPGDLRSFFTPAPFVALDTAIAAASEWAAKNGAPPIFVRDTAFH